VGCINLIDFKKLQQLLQRENTSEQKDFPKHVILNLFPIITTEEKKKEEYEKFLSLIEDIVDLQVEKNIPIFTISLGKRENIPDETMLSVFCDKLLEKAIQKKINVSVFGRWYDLSGELVEALKKINNETNDFDSFFFNICINYEGKQEIADASRVIIRKISMDKADFDSISPDLLKENIYSSYFIPADLIIESSNRFTGTFLWDSVNAKIYFLNEEVMKINKEDIEKAIMNYAKN
jgi:undecaprenyl diphosphate synthase